MERNENGVNLGMVIFYSICLAITILELIWLQMSDVRQSINQLISVLIIIISDIGYIYLSRAMSFKEALLADKITRIGGVFLPLFFFFMVCEVCHIEIKKWICLVMVSIQTFLYGMICFFDFGIHFYNSVGFQIDKAGGHLSWTYGPLHYIYVFMIAIYFIGILGISIYSMAKNRSVNNTDLIQLLAFSIIVFAGVVIDRIMGLHTELMPMFYCIVIYGALMPIYNSNIYTVYENRNIINAELDDIGFIAFDTRLNYMGCDEFMLQLFPELKNLEVGKPVKKYSDKLQKNILRPVVDYRNFINGVSDGDGLNSHTTFNIGEKYYDGKIHMIKDFLKRCKGFTMVVTDETEHHEALSFSEKYNDTLSQEVTTKTKKIRSIQAKIILGMAQVVESRDLSTGGHVKRTSEVVKIFSEQLLQSDMGFDKKFLKLVERSAPMHDIGKIGVDDSILRLKSKYNDEQYNMMKKHSEIGAKMVRKILTGVEEEQFVQIAENIAHYHHEKVNGQGYPCGLVGKEIPIEARIMAIADVFDALVSKRCYKEAFSYDKAFSIIEEDSGTHFDESLVKVFLCCRPQLEKYYDKEREKGY
mgnify:CR=1 FL=1